MAYQLRPEMAGYPPRGPESISSAYTPSVSSSQLPYTPRTPPPIGFMMATYPEDSRYPRRPAASAYPITSSRVSLQSGVKYQPLKQVPSGGKVMCAVVYGLLAFGILLGFILAVAFGVSWKPKWGYP